MLERACLRHNALMGRHNSGGRAPLRAWSRPPTGRSAKRRPVSSGVAWPTTSLLTLGTAGIVAAVIFSAAGAGDRARTPSHRGNLAAGSSRVAAPARSPMERMVMPKNRPTVVLRVVGVRSWIRVKDVNHRVLVEAVLTTGKVLSFTGPVFYIEVGDGGAVTIADKGMHPMTLGPAGSTARRTVKGP